MLDRFTGLNVFLRVAQHQSLSAAARVLGMSQTMATKHMAALEHRLGTKLLHRTTRRVSLTEAGRAYLESTERILAELDEADARASIDVAEVRGTLRLNVPVSFGIREMAAMLPIFAERHPGLTVDLGVNDRFVDLVEEGWDLAIRIGNLKSSSLIARRLAPCEMVVCAAPGYVARHGRPTSTAQLKEHNCLGYTLSRDAPADRWQFGRDGQISVPVKGNLKASNGDILVAAAVAGQGIVYQPKFLVARELRQGLLIELTLDQPLRALDGIYAAYPSDRRPPAKVRAAIDFFAEQLSSSANK